MDRRRADARRGMALCQPEVRARHDPGRNSGFRHAVAGAEDLHRLRRPAAAEARIHQDLQPHQRNLWRRQHDRDGDRGRAGHHLQRQDAQAGLRGHAGHRQFAEREPQPGGQPDPPHRAQGLPHARRQLRLRGLLRRAQGQPHERGVGATAKRRDGQPAHLWSAGVAGLQGRADQGPAQRRRHRLPEDLCRAARGAQDAGDRGPQDLRHRQPGADGLGLHLPQPDPRHHDVHAGTAGAAADRVLSALLRRVLAAGGHCAVVDLGPGLHGGGGL